MATYTVQQASKTKDVNGTHGPMMVVALQLVGVEGAVTAEWFTRAASELPQPGSQIEGDVTHGQYGLKFKKSSSLGPQRGRSPEETKSIVRQHSQHMALLYTQVKAMTNQLPEHYGMAELRMIIDWFDNDAHEGWKATSRKYGDPKPLPATGQSDVPNDGFEPPSEEDVEAARELFEEAK